jgi:hypothetical protein
VALDPFARRARLNSNDLIHDGDTLYLEYDAGCTGRMEPDLRLQDTYMPEIDELGGTYMRGVAIAWAGEWMNHNPQLTWPFWITMTMTKHQEPKQKLTFARYLAMVYRFDGKDIVGRSLNAILNDELETHPEWGHGNKAVRGLK